MAYFWGSKYVMKRNNVDLINVINEYISPFLGITAWPNVDEGDSERSIWKTKIHIHDNKPSEDGYHAAFSLLLSSKIHSRKKHWHLFRMESCRQIVHFYHISRWSMPTMQQQIPLPECFRWNQTSQDGHQRSQICHATGICVFSRQLFICICVVQNRLRN